VHEERGDHGAPRTDEPVGDAAGEVSIEEFGEYVGELGRWTMDAKAALLEFWGITEEQYDDSLVHHKAFDACLTKWYTLKYEERS
jgi:hypothetical protein